MNTLIWIAQSLLAVLFILHGIAIFNPPAAVQDSVIKKMGFTLPFLKIVGSLELLGGFGVILPSWTRIMPLLSPMAALGLVVIMLGAVVSHARQAEGKQTVVTSIVTLLAVFVVIGRFWLVPII